LGWPHTNKIWLFSTKLDRTVMMPRKDEYKTA
jgi:hypothetical protein